MEGLRLVRMLLQLGVYVCLGQLILAGACNKYLCLGTVGTTRELGSCAYLCGFMNKH